jgi:glycosyltransferase involved in cell wall biosynthesis
MEQGVKESVMDEARPLEICLLGSIESIHTRNRKETLAARGHAVRLVAQSPELLSPTERYILRSIYARLQQLRRLRADIFHVQFAAGADAWLAAVAGLQPLVVSVWGGDVLFSEQGNTSWLAQRLTRDLLEAADLVTAESQRMVEVVQQLCPRARISPIHWGIDLDIFKKCDRTARAVRARFGIAEGTLVLLSPKLLTRFYNIHILIDALRLVAREHPGVVLLLSTFNADPVYRHELEQRASTLGMKGNIIFLPPLEHNELAGVYNAADLVVTVPPSDGLPRTLMEASACGVPSILSDLPAYAEFVTHEQSALLVPIEVDAVAASVLRLVHDRALYNRLQRNVLALAELRFDRHSESARIEALYCDLMSSPRRHRSMTARAAMMARLLVHFGLHL